MSETTFLAEGHQVGNFVIEKFLGNGACAKIYQAKSALSGREAVIKIFDADFSSHSFYGMMLTNEADRASQATHPNVIAILESGREGECLYMAMDIVQGDSIADLMLRNGRMKAYDLLEYGADIASGLDWMERELHHYHRDIKPANIMVSRGKAILIDLDFDTLRIRGDHDDQIWGTPEYLAPEMMRAGRKANRETDIYALGCTLFHALLGHPPFWTQRPKNPSAMQIVESHIEGTLERPSKYIPGLPKRAENILVDCIARAPSHRPGAYPELIERLREAQVDCLNIGI